MEKKMHGEPADMPMRTESEAPIYELNLTQDELILLYNVIGSFSSNLQTTMVLCPSNTGADAEEVLIGCQNIRRKIFIESGLA